MKSFNFDSSNDYREIIEDSIPDVQGVILDALVNEEKAIAALDKIQENFETARSRIEQASGGVEAVAEKLSDGLAMQLGNERLKGTQGISQLIQEVADAKQSLIASIESLNTSPSLEEDLTESFQENPALAILGATITTMTTLLGVIGGGAVAGPVGMVAGGAAGMSAGGALSGELVADHFSELASSVSEINNIADILSSFANNLGDAVDWLQAEVSNIDQEQPEDTQED